MHIYNDTESPLSSITSYEGSKINFYGNFYRTKTINVFARLIKSSVNVPFYFQVIEIVIRIHASYYLEQLSRTIREICLRVSILGMAACAGETVCGWTRAYWYMRERGIKGVCTRETDDVNESEKERRREKPRKAYRCMRVTPIRLTPETRISLSSQALGK